MTNNYDIINNEINRVLYNIYKDINDYLENIITAPSTINRIFKYYAIGLPADPIVNERYIMFGGTVVRKYVIENPLEDIELQKKLRELRK